MDEPTTQRELTLLELVDRLIEGGVVIHGDITLSVADIDLVYVGLRALVTTVTGLEKAGGELPPSVRTSAL